MITPIVCQRVFAFAAALSSITGYALTARLDCYGRICADMGWGVLSMGVR